MNNTACILHYSRDALSRIRITSHWCQTQEIADFVQNDLWKRTQKRPEYIEVVQDQFLAQLRARSGPTVTVPESPLSFHKSDYQLLRQSVTNALAKGSREGVYYKIHATHIIYCIDIPAFQSIKTFFNL